MSSCIHGIVPPGFVSHRISYLEIREMGVIVMRLPGNELSKSLTQSQYQIPRAKFESESRFEPQTSRSLAWLSTSRAILVELNFFLKTQMPLAKLEVESE